MANVGENQCPLAVSNWIINPFPISAESFFLKIWQKTFFVKNQKVKVNGSETGCKIVYTLSSKFLVISTIPQ
jgi:hypothetical protein